MKSPKWMHAYAITAKIYDRHPDTGDGQCLSAYVYIGAKQTEQALMSLFAKHGWTYLRKDRSRLVFYTLKT